MEGLRSRRQNIPSSEEDKNSDVEENPDVFDAGDGDRMGGDDSVIDKEFSEQSRENARGFHGNRDLNFADVDEGLADSSSMEDVRPKEMSSSHMAANASYSLMLNDAGARPRVPQQPRNTSLDHGMCRDRRRMDAKINNKVVRKVLGERKKLVATTS